MRKSYLLWGILGLVALALAGFGGWLLTLPNPVSTAAPDVPPSETEAMLASLKPPKRERPLVAIIGINDATETTDYMMPAGILRRADVADVVMLATEPGPVRLYPPSRSSTRRRLQNSTPHIRKAPTTSSSRR